MTQATEGATTPRPHRTVTRDRSHVAVAHRAGDHLLSVKGIFDLARKNLVRTVLRVSLTELIAVSLTKRPQTTTLRNDSSGYTSTSPPSHTVRSGSHVDALLSFNLLDQMRK